MNKIEKGIKINKKTERKTYSKQTGITLIALVITIVVLLILAGVSINALFSDNGIIERAKNAQNKVDEAEQSDLEEVNKANKWLEEKGGIKNEAGEDTPTSPDAPFGGEEYDKASKNEDGTLKENAEYVDLEQAKVTIPKGFKVSDVAGTESTDGEQTVSKGLVIRDKDGNEFVWVPVNYTATGKDENSNELDDGFEATFKRSTTNSSYTEPYANGYSGEDTDYMNMMKSVQANKGFYIGRYEAGTTSPRTDTTTTTSKVVVKRDAYPYIYVGWGNAMNDITTDVTRYNTTTKRGKGAVYLSKNMYTAGEIGATSSLCYGVQWEAIMKFVEDSTHSTTNSTTWGNYKDNAWKIDRTTASYTDSTNVATGSWTKITSNKSKTNSESILLTTGASDSFKAKNIFDLAGNVYEWTMEARNSNGRVGRGGNYYNSGSNNPASDRNYPYPTRSLNDMGFRPALYL